MIGGILGQHPVCMRCNEAAITDCEASPADKLVERQTVLVMEPPRPNFNELALPAPVTIEVHLSGTQQTRRFSVGDAVEIVGTLQCSSKDKENRVQVFIDCHYAQTKSLTLTHVNRQIIHEALASHPQVSDAWELKLTSQQVPAMALMPTLPLLTRWPCVLSHAQGILPGLINSLAPTVLVRAARLQTPRLL